MADDEKQKIIFTLSGTPEGVRRLADNLQPGQFLYGKKILDVEVIEDNLLIIQTKTESEAWQIDAFLNATPFVIGTHTEFNKVLLNQQGALAPYNNKTITKIRTLANAYLRALRAMEEHKAKYEDVTHE